jgi:hypothetical protein
VGGSKGFVGTEVVSGVGGSRSSGTEFTLEMATGSELVLDTVDWTLSVASTSTSWTLSVFPRFLLTNSMLIKYVALQPFGKV